MNWQSLYEPEMCDRLCRALAHSLWQSTLCALLAAIAGRWLLRDSLRASYCAHVAALAACAIALPLTLVVVSLPGSLERESPAAIAGGSAARLVMTPAIDRAGGEGLTTPTEAFADQTSAEVSSAHSPWRIGNHAAVYLCGFYVIGVSGMLLRLARGVAVAERWRRAAPVIETGAAAVALRQLAQRWRLRAVPLIARSESILVPAVVGLIQPVILIPTAALSGLTAEELQWILAHELAHIRRGDVWVNLMQRVLEAVLFFNPAVWYLSRRVDVLREYCCDELACDTSNMDETSQSAARLGYATALVRVVEIAQPALAAQHNLAALAASGRQPSQLRRRLARLLGEPVSEPLRLSQGAWWLAIAALVMTCGPTLLATQPQTANDAQESARAVPPPTTNEAPAGEKANAARDARSVKTLACGAKVELLALGIHGKDAPQWWNAEGQILALDQFTWSDNNNVASSDKKWRRLIFRIETVPEGADLQWHIVRARASAGGNVSMQGEATSKNIHARYFSVADLQNTVDLRVGIATGPWTKVTELSHAPQVESLQRRKAIVSSGAIAQSGETMLVVSHNFSDQSVRIVALDRQGHTHESTLEASSRSGVSAPAINQVKIVFPGLAADQIDHFEFQVRDYEWVEFKGLPLSPTGTAAVQLPRDRAQQIAAVDPNQKGASYAGQDLTGATINGGIKSFSSADFTEAVLDKATLKGDAAFQRANFTRASLSDATLHGGASGFQLAVFDDATANRAVMVGGASSFQLASFAGAKLHAARLNGVGGAFQKANFDRADLSAAIIQCDSAGAFQGVRLNGTDLRGTDLRTVDHRSLESCEFNADTPPIYSSTTRLPAGFDPRKTGWRLSEAGEKAAPPAKN